MKHRRRHAETRWLYNLLPSSVRRTLAGVSFGISIGVAGTLVLIGIEDKGSETDRHAPKPLNHTSLKQNNLPYHEALRYGVPSNSNVYVRSGYVVSYDYRTRNASWVMEYLTQDALRIKHETNRANSKFAVDCDIPEQFRVNPKLYHNSGYDKGHLVPARDMSHSQKAMDESFFMTNMSPQIGLGFNRDYWARLEGFVRHLTSQYDAVYVITGPLFLPKKNKKRGGYMVSYSVLGDPPDAVAIPTHFFKEHGNGFATAGFILPNKIISENKSLRDFQVPLNVIEKQAGLLFFNKVLALSKKLHSSAKVELCSEIKCSLAAVYRQTSSKVGK
ncbi:hypothetical protein CCR75_006650 [Bremia lactucae]|uniref:Endonuclease n=1 Tax=Bremia lactucae TaxID=4779 RepID=A0A976IA00_BRELC|nr:hypothetical protein CCR75_006650 [Bremia lactucae]